MLYVKTINLDGTLTFAPIRNDNVYQYCTTCGRFVPILDLLDLVGELGEADIECEIMDICEECLDERCEREDEYCRKHYPQNYAEEEK